MNTGAIRFLMTFDDGPHRHTGSVLEHLNVNPVQRGIKAVFFVQTRYADAGGSWEGRRLIEREYAEGHVLGLHTGSRLGHVSHTRMSSCELEQSLVDGAADLQSITGTRTWLVRPPYWWFNRATVAQYDEQGLHMVLSDVKAYDGVNWGMHVFRRWNFRSQLTEFRRRLRHETFPTVRGVMPMVVTFHDTNAYTAGHLPEYLELLVHEAERVGLSVDRKPYYDEAREVLEAALERAVHPFHASLPGGRHTVAS